MEMRLRPTDRTRASCAVPALLGADGHGRKDDSNAEKSLDDISVRDENRDIAE